MKLDATVLLRSFNLHDEAPWGIDPRENYWLLVGQRGRIVDINPSGGIGADRVLVQFDCDVQALGLHCHNHIDNALWIKQADLEVEQ